jgi:DNA modification methylase
MPEVLLDGKVELHCGDSLKFLKDIPANWFHSIVCDPPYALVSIGKRFGADGAAAVKVPDGGSGAYARASAGFMGKKWDTGETAFAVEFWAECLRVLKPGGHVVAFGGTRTYHRLACAIEDGGFEIRDQLGWCFGSGFPKSHNAGNGWGTALKPAWEPICLARKPLIGTVAENVLQHGVGALNIDGCRISTDETLKLGKTGLASDKFFTRGDVPEIEKFQHAAGRWPANLVHDGSDEVLAAFPETGISSGGSGEASQKTALAGDVYGKYSGATLGQNAGGLGDGGSAARFFYTAKADADDRLGSKHPTVKPVDLMQWLVRLVTPKGGLVLDPFAGTGTTGEAAFREGMRCVLVERETEYQEDIRRRMRLALGGPEERRRESIKAKKLPIDDGPLFATTR